MPLTDDPDLHLLADGRRVQPTYRRDGIYGFHLPVPPAELRIVSRSAAPQELGLARDPRQLGVPVQTISLKQGARTRLVAASDPALTKGFHSFEADNAIRWTNGDAVFPTGLFDGVGGKLELTLQLNGATHYVDEGILRAAG